MYTIYSVKQLLKKNSFQKLNFEKGGRSLHPWANVCTIDEVENMFKRRDLLAYRVSCNVEQQRRGLTMPLLLPQ